MLAATMAVDTRLKILFLPSKSSKYKPTLKKENREGYDSCNEIKQKNNNKQKQKTRKQKTDETRKTIMP